MCVNMIMKLLLMVYLFINVHFNNFVMSKRQLFPNLPVGEYQVRLNGILRCNPLPTKNELQFNWYLNKRTATVTEIKGNTSMLIPIDDSFFVERNMVVKDSIGGWKDNAYLFTEPRSCTNLKAWLGNAWHSIMGSLGVKNASSPIPASFYILLGLTIDTSLMKETNIFKTFFYGSYKFRLSFKKNKEVYGCIIFVIDIVCPWDKFQ